MKLNSVIFVVVLLSCVGCASISEYNDNNRSLTFGLVEAFENGYSERPWVLGLPQSGRVIKRFQEKWKPVFRPKTRLNKPGETKTVYGSTMMCASAAPRPKSLDSAASASSVAGYGPERTL